MSFLYCHPLFKPIHACFPNGPSIKPTSPLKNIFGSYRKPPGGRLYAHKQRKSIKRVERKKTRNLKKQTFTPF